MNRYFLIDICTYDLSKLVKQARILCTALKLEVGSWKRDKKKRETYYPKIFYKEQQSQKDVLVWGWQISDQSLCLQDLLLIPEPEKPP